MMALVHEPLCYCRWCEILFFSLLGIHLQFMGGDSRISADTDGIGYKRVSWACKILNLHIPYNFLYNFLHKSFDIGI